MSLRASLVALALVGFLTIAPYAPPKPHVAPIGHLTYSIYILGDSITFGRSASSLATSYRGLITAYIQRNPRIVARIEDTPPDTTQYGATWQSGWTLANALTAEATTPPQQGTSLIIIEIGTNDVIASTPLATFTSGYHMLISDLEAAAPTAEVVCMNAWNPADLSAPYDAVIASDCPGGRVVDLTTLYGEGDMHGPAGIPEPWLGAEYVTDAFHLNDKAHAAAASETEAFL